MKISPDWLREFLGGKLPDDQTFAEAITLAGIAVESVAKLPSGEAMFHMDITTNRVDAMNHYGIAREISAIYGLDLKPLSARLPAARGNTNVQIEIQEPTLCTRFSGQVIRNVNIGQSGDRVRKRFAQVEQKLINSAADATNYVLLMMGKPTHAFDLDKLEGGKLIIRLAKPGETHTTLDGIERKLHPEDLVVADARKPVALAGVMGGWDSMITDATKNILIESAWFDPATVRRTSRRHILHTDASHRFERGADFASCPISVELVTQIILESGGELEGGLIDVVAKPFSRAPITLRLSEVTRILGKEIAAAEVESILRKLGFTPTRKGSDYSVELPTWRLDVEREIDLVEEIARIHGFNKFPNALPGFSGAVIVPLEAAKRARIRETLLALGYNEAMSSTFIAKEESIASSAPETKIVEIANPLSEEAASMRASLVPGMLQMIAGNLNRGADPAAVRLFEAGHVFSLRGDGVDEHDSLCIGATAAAITNGQAQEAAQTFLRFKGDIESLLSRFDLSGLHFTADANDAGQQQFHPGRSAKAGANASTLVRFGQLHPQAASARKLKQDIYLADVALEKLLALPFHAPRYERLSRYPAVERDFSFLFAKSVSFGQIESAIQSLKLPELRSVTPAEIYSGEKMEPGKYSILVRATFQSNDRTLRDDEVAHWSARIVDALKSLGGIQRA
jgi:phenylalanyl-tRNA synthetase beta chain